MPGKPLAVRSGAIVLACSGLMTGAFVSMGAATADARLKCGLPADRALVAIDGAIVDRQPEEIPRERVALIEVVCMDPVDSTFNLSVGIPVVSLWTVEGPVPKIEPALASVLEAQDRHLRDEGAYATALDRLALPEIPSPIVLSLTTTAAGWIATARVDRLLHGCQVFDGRVIPPPADLAPRTPDCVDERMLGSH